MLSEYTEEALMDRLGMGRDPPQTPNSLQHRFAGLIPVSSISLAVTSHLDQRGAVITSTVSSAVFDTYLHGFANCSSSVQSLIHFFLTTYRCKTEAHAKQGGWPLHGLNEDMREILNPLKIPSNR